MNFLATHLGWFVLGFVAGYIVAFVTDRAEKLLEGMQWICDGCGARYAEYVNGCPKCSERGLYFSVRLQ